MNHGVPPVWRGSSGRSGWLGSMSYKENCNNKYEFEKTKIEYLGLIISEGQVEMDPIKVNGVTAWLMPMNKKEVQSFLGFINFFFFLSRISHIMHNHCST
ncbi:hypothetical protein L208DRAFT_1556764 [Tricholoma matsutake]|nr:hypothetical protein L208DRAFT_1556764 [Tricholoma matsutake 945]